VTAFELEPSFDQELANSYRGKYILVGVTYLDPSGNVSSQVQVHGVIESASARDGIQIALRGVCEGQLWTMPPALDAIHPATRGRYTLRTTGETVDDPDLLATWDVYPPDSYLESPSESNTDDVRRADFDTVEHSALSKPAGPPER
jgi:hypothetical protein